MSNKLKTLSAVQLETLIGNVIGDYLEEECKCKVTNLDTPNINSEEDVAIADKRTMTFDVEVSYEE